jgi:hypothetical protein
MKPHESLPVGRARQEMVALRPGLRGRYYAAGRLGTGLQRAPGSQSARTGLSLANPRIQVTVIRCIREARQNRPILAGIVVPCRGSKSLISRAT